MTTLRKIAKAKLAAAGLVIIAIVTFCALLAGIIAPYDPLDQNIAQRLKPPMSILEDGRHILGTDALGRDVLSRLIYGSRIALIVGVSTVAISGTIGVVAGLIAGYDDRVGRSLMAFADVQLAIPFLVLALAVVAIVGPSLLNLILILGVTNWVQYARVVRSEVLALREREFVQAANALGASTGRILFKSLLPNVASSIIVLSSLQVARLILFEASLSFLGLGVPPSIPSWGSMISDGRNYIGNAWWVSAMPGFALFILVVAINVVGDRLRDVLDPRLRGLER
jgi:peptide/nickel transport system permease protein